MNRIITKVNYVKYFTEEIVDSYFFKFNRSAINAFLVFMRMTVGTIKGPPNLFKRAQRLSHSLFEHNLLLALA